MIHYRCPTCQAAHASMELMAGMTVICKQCKQPIEVPKESTAPAPEPVTPKRVENPPPASEPALQPNAAPPVAPEPTATPATSEPLPAPRSKHARLWLLPIVGVCACAFIYLAWITLRTPPMRVLSGHEGPVWCVAYSPDGRTVVSAGEDAALILWNAGNGRELLRFEGHTDTVSAVAFARDGRFVISGSFDNTVRLWDAASGELIAIYAGHQAPILSVALSRDNSVGVSASADQTVRVWDILQVKEHARLGAGRTIEKQPEQTLRALGRLPVAGDLFTSAHFTPDDRFILSTNLKGIISLWNEKGQKQRDVGAMPAPALSAALSRDGQFVLVAGGPYEQAERGDFDLVLWDIAAGSKAGIYTGHTDCVTSVALSPDGKRALSGSRDRTVRLWDLESGDELARLDGHTDFITSVAFSPDGSRAASCSFDRTVRLWRLPD